MNSIRSIKLRVLDEKNIFGKYTHYVEVHPVLWADLYLPENIS